MVTAVLPGSFNPPTNGHIDIIKRCAAVFDRVYVVVMRNNSKKYLFTKEECVEMLKLSTKDIENIVIDQSEGLVVDYAKKINAKVIVKGLRNAHDLDYELQMAAANNQLSGIETMLIASKGEHTHISSSLVREIASLKGDISHFVPKEIEDIILKKFKE